MTRPNNRNNGCIHEDVHYRARPDKDLNRGKGGILKSRIVLFKLLGLITLTNKGFYNSNVSNVLTNCGVKLINLRLKLLKSRETESDKEEERYHHQGHCNRKDYRKAGLKVNCHYDTADKHTGETERHTKEHVNEVLNLCYVICHSGNKRSCGELINICKGILLYLLVHILTKVGRKVNRCLRAEVCACNTATHHEKHDSDKSACETYALSNGQSTVVCAVNKLRKKQRHEHFTNNLDNHAKRAENKG